MPRLINLICAHRNLFALAAASTTHASAYGLNGEDRYAHPCMVEEYRALYSETRQLWDVPISRPFDLMLGGDQRRGRGRGHVLMWPLNSSASLALLTVPIFAWRH
jgi:hypothetical protein